MAGSSGAIRAGEAYVELGTKDGPLQKGLKAAERQLAAWGSAVQQAGAGLAASGAARLAIGAAALKVFSDLGSELRNLAIQTGISVESLQGLGATARRNGSSMEELAGGIGKMERFLVQAAEGGDAANMALSRLGLSITELANLNPEQQFERIAQAISAIQNPAERARRTMEIFGRGGAALIPTLQALASGNRVRPGRIITTEEAESAHQFGNSIQALYGDLKKLAFIVGLALLPMAEKFVRWLKEGVEWVIKFVDTNKELIVTMALGAATDVALGAALYGLGAAVGVVSSAFGVLATTVTVTTAVLGFLFSAATLVALPLIVLGGALAYLIYSNEHVQQSIRDLMPSLTGLGATFQTVWGGIMDAIMAGDIAGAFEMAWAGAELVFTRFSNWVMNRLRYIQMGFEQVWDEIGTDFARTMNMILLSFNTLIRMLPQPMQQALLAAGVGQIDVNPADVDAQLLADLDRRRRERGRQLNAANDADNAHLQEAQDNLDRMAEEMEGRRRDAEAARAGAIRDSTAGAGLTLAMSSQGTFSANQAAAFGAASTPAERTATAAEELVAQGERMIRALRDAQVVWNT